MDSIRWFDRRFDFDLGVDQFDPLLDRLRCSFSHFHEQIAQLSESTLTLQPDSKWSIKENIGHLIVLEPLWRIRFEEIQREVPRMALADLNNTATNAAAFNTVSIVSLLQVFARERDITVEHLSRVSREELHHVSVHPRLQQPMRIVDLMLFVAEHDDHHWNAMERIMNHSRVL